MPKRLTVLGTIVLAAVLLAVVVLVYRSTLAQGDDQHPRLLFTADDIPALRQQAATHPDIYAPIEEWAATQLGTTPPWNGGGSAYLEWGSMIINFAYTCLITDNPDYCNLAQTYLLQYAQWDQWNEGNRRDLDLAHMLMGTSLAYDWLYDRLTDTERQTVHNALLLWGERMYEASTENYRFEWVNWWSSSYIQNHHWINHAALGLAGLVLLDTGGASADNATCTATAAQNVNLRSGPTTAEDNVAGVLRGSESVAIIGQTVGPGGHVWWQTEGGLWVRSDVVTVSGNCALVPAPESRDPAVWVERAMRQLLIVRDTLNEIKDGSWHEGLNYQTYGLTMALPFMVSLRNVTGEDILPHNYLRAYPTWRAYNLLPGTINPALRYSDYELWWGNSWQSQNVLRFIAAEYDDPLAEWVAQEIVALDGRPSSRWSTPWNVLELLYYDDSITPQPPDDLPLACTFTDLEGVIWRSGWDEDAITFGLKSGAYGGRFAYDQFIAQAFPPWHEFCLESGCTFNISHDHADATTFYLYRGGEALTTEFVGFGDDRNRTSEHNAILIDGQGQIRPETNDYGDPAAFAGTDATLDVTASAPHVEYLAADATNRYAWLGGIEAVTRHSLYLRPDLVLLLDNLAAADPHQYDWQVYVNGTPNLTDGWLRTETEGGSVLGMTMAASTDVQPIILGGDPVRVTWRTNAPIADARLVSLLYPTDAAGWESRPTLTTQEDGAGMILAQVSHWDGRHDALIAYANAGQAHTVGGYRFDGQAAVVSLDSSGRITALFATGGTTLADDVGGRMLVEGLTGAGTFAASFSGEQVAVSGDPAALAGTVRLYAPGVTTLTVNGLDWSFTRDGDAITFTAGDAPTPQLVCTFN